MLYTCLQLRVYFHIKTNIYLSFYLFKYTHLCVHVDLQFHKHISTSVETQLGEWIAAKTDKSNQLKVQKKYSVYLFIFQFIHRGMSSRRHAECGAVPEDTPKNTPTGPPHLCTKLYICAVVSLFVWTLKRTTGVLRCASPCIQRDLRVNVDICMPVRICMQVHVSTLTLVCTDHIELRARAQIVL